MLGSSFNVVPRFQFRPRGPKIVNWDGQACFTYYHNSDKETKKIQLQVVLIVNYKKLHDDTTYVLLVYVSKWLQIETKSEILPMSKMLYM